MMGLLDRGRYQRILRAVVMIAGLLWLLGGSAHQAVAAPITAGKPLAQLPNAAQKLTAYDGYVVFSEYEATTRDWHLMVWHGGSIKPLPVLARDMPFDANAGPAANGRPAIVYSRCAQDPPPPTANDLQSSEYVREPVWTDARGCRIYELALPNGSPKFVKGIYKPGASDSTPAIWDGNIAFARLTAGSRDARVYLWHHSTRRLTALGGGPGPCRAGVVRGRCVAHPSTPPSAWVGGMSLDGSALGYEWIFCEGPEEILSSFKSYSATTRTWRGARFDPGLVVAIAEDHGTTYWIRHDLKEFGPNDRCSPGLSACSGEAFTEAHDCSPDHGTCTLMQTNDLPLGSPQRRSPGV